MKKHFRKSEYYTITESTEPIELDSEKFPNFDGETEEDFYNYIVENYEDLASDDSIDEETQNLLWELIQGDTDITHDSRYKGSNESIDMGYVDSSGDFESEYDGW